MSIPAPQRPTGLLKMPRSDQRSCGPCGKTAYPGDLAAGDDDGVRFIRPETANLLADATLAAEVKEADHIISDGTYHRPRGEEKLQEIGCEML